MTHIAAFLPNWIGDVAMCTPALRALAHRFQDGILTVVGRQTACELVRGLPWIRREKVIPSQPNVVQMASIAHELRQCAEDLAVIFPHSFRSALLAWLTRSRRRLGYARDRRKPLLTDPVEPPMENGQVRPIYMADEYLHLVGQLGCKDDGAGLELVADSQTVESVIARLPEDRPLVGIAPGATFGPSKRWPIDRFARVADLLHERAGARSVVLCGPDERDLRETLLAKARTRLVCCDDGNPTIAMLKATVSQLDLLICNDSGPRHVAVAFGVPTVCIMGPTSPRYSEGPYERGKVLRVDVDCGPCQKPTCVTDHRCMTQILPEHVVEAVLNSLPR